MTVFETLNETFDHIYIISLKRSTERHPVLKERLNGLNYEIFWGVDGQKLDINRLIEEGIYDSEKARSKKKELKLPPRDLSMSILGCAMSHLGVYKDAIQNGYSKVLIMEDDITVDHDKDYYLRQALKELPSDWELLYLGYLFNNNRMTWKAALRYRFVYPLLTLFGYDRYDPYRYRCKFPRSYSDHLELAGFHYGAHAYGVTLNGLKKILENQSPIVMEADNAISEMCQNETIRAFRIKQRIFHQDRDQFQSQISSEYEVS
jgi:glycosyl transferase, family 25